MEAATEIKKNAAASEKTHLEFADVAAIGTHYAKFHRRHKRKMKRGSFGQFERRYSKLALENSLIPERKRIDYVLVHPNVYAKDTKDPVKKLELERHEKNRERFMKLMERDGFSIQTDIIGEHVFLKLHCPFKRMCAEAEKVHLDMPLKDMEIPEPKPGNFLMRFADRYLESENDVSDFVSAPFSMIKIHLFQGYEDPTHFFRPCVRSLLVHHILINLDIRTAKEVEEDALDSDDENENTTCSCCPSFCRKAFCLQSKGPQKPPAESQNKTSLKRKGLPFLLMKGTFSDYMVLHDDSIKSREKEDKPSDHFMTSEVSSLSPLDNDPRKDLDDLWTKFFKFQPLWHIRDYFGEKIALYFAWSGMLITTLWIPVIFGIIVFFYGLYQSLDETTTVSNATATTPANQLQDVLGDVKRAFDNDITPFFALFICCWGTIFLEMWKRERSTLAYEWDVDQFEANEPNRPQFYGTVVKKNPVTNEDARYYPFRRQILKLATSFSVLCFMVCLVIVSVIAIIAYRVIMNVDYCPDLSDNECFVLTTVISSVLNAVSILILGKIYDKLAALLTDWENHRTQTQYDDALIIKLFGFQFVNSYASCFYIAFFRGNGSIFEDRYVDSCEGSCMTQLSFQVMILMLVKPFPKFAKDIILPLVRSLWRRRPECCRCRCFPCCRQNQVTEMNKPDQDGVQCSSHMGFLERERLKPDLQDFTLGEYTEKVILYGFLMLFASSFPLAPLLALVICYVDIRIDAKRMLWWFRRPIGFIAEDIGMWRDILNLVNFIGVITNAFIIAFTSNWGSQFDTAGKLWVVIGFEHIVFALKIFLAYMIPDVPQKVKMAIRREKYLVHQKLNEDKPKDVDYSKLYPSTFSEKDVIEEDDEEVEVTAPTKATSKKRDDKPHNAYAKKNQESTWEFDAKGDKSFKHLPTAPSRDVLYGKLGGGQHRPNESNS